METSRLMEPLMVEVFWRSGRLVHEKSMIGAVGATSNVRNHLLEITMMKNWGL
jgi:hypothetical protein